MPAVSLILITHNSAPWLPAFFDSWQKSLAAAPALQSEGIEIIAADSGSLDDSVALIQTIAPSAQVFACGNVGFGAAANFAAKKAQSPWLLICNPDLTFPENFAQQFLAPAHSPFQSPWNSAACLAPKLLNPDNTLQPSVGRFPTLFRLLADQFRPRVRRKYHFPQPTKAAPIDWATGACLLFRRDVFLNLGGFDPKYFLYVEEVDLQRRLHNAGHKTWFFPDVAVIHHHPNAARQPRPEIQTLAARGLLRYFAKFSPLTLPLYRLIALATRRLPAHEALASRKKILITSTGPE